MISKKPIDPEQRGGGPGCPPARGGDRECVANDHAQPEEVFGPHAPFKPNGDRFSLPRSQDATRSVNGLALLLL